MAIELRGVSARPCISAGHRRGERMESDGKGEERYLCCLLFLLV